MLFASLALIVMFLFWRPIPTTVWNIENPIGAVFMWALFAIGWAIVLMSTFLLSHFELFGLPQVWSHARVRAVPPTTFRDPFIYQTGRSYVRERVWSFGRVLVVAIS